jgi:uncharacterized membrane protein YjjB (DUF3815 family)
MASLPAPAWTLALALLVAPACYAVLLRAPRRDFGWIVAMATLAFASARVGTVWIGPGVGAFLGSFSVGCAANLNQRALKRPAVVPLIPGLLVLVPGTIGFQSFDSLIRRDVVAGIDTVITMLTVAIALVMGLVVSQVLVPNPNRDTA